ncbi:hypothetical protein FHS68_004388 [Dyadobacter arcticus]|uniref:Uncharacterized protein n=1 Tax=Dyadobacter arcticus TaxID=1078754 RepID=A0ABX0UQE3_9BACT|nr:hypothetical protein [Dyadobacter arcticus]
MLYWLVARNKRPTETKAKDEFSLYSKAIIINKDLTGFELVKSLFKSSPTKISFQYLF